MVLAEATPMLRRRLPASILGTAALCGSTLGCVIDLGSLDVAETDSETSTATGSPTSTGTEGADETGTGTADGSGSADDSSGSDTSGGAVVDPLELLEPGPHLGMIVGFEAPAPGTETEVDGRWNEAIAAGMDVGRIQIDWADLEPTPGVYELEDLVQQLESLQSDGLQVMVTLSTLDSLEYTLPEDLEDPEVELGLVGGIAFDDPVITDRFAALLDVVVPLVVDHGGFLITVGNEPDNHFEQQPGLATEVAGFVAAARDHAATLDPALAISMTLTYGSVDTHEVSQAIIDEVPVATFNLYCQGEDGSVQEPEMVAPRVAAMLEVVGDKPVVIQELGCPAGYEDGTTTIDGDLDKQARYFQAFAEQMQADDRLRAAFVFQMLDWSPSLAELFAQELAALGFGQAVIDLFTESLSTTGLCRWQDVSCRPAWDSVLDAIAEFQS